MKRPLKKPDKYFAYTVEVEVEVDEFKPFNCCENTRISIFPSYKLAKKYYDSETDYDHKALIGIEENKNDKIYGCNEVVLEATCKDDE